jgi:hypothetical protein
MGLPASEPQRPSCCGYSQRIPGGRSGWPHQDDKGQQLHVDDLEQRVNEMRALAKQEGGTAGENDEVRACGGGFQFSPG